MLPFEEIENQFLDIKSDNFSEQILFYEMHEKQLLKYLDFQNKYETEKSICILSEVAQAFIELEKKKEGYLLALRVKRLFDLYSKRFKKDLSDNNFYLSTLWMTAIYNFDSKKYLSAFLAFRKTHLVYKKNDTVKGFLESSRNNLIKKIANIALVIAILILILKMSIQNFTEIEYFDTTFWFTIDLFFFTIFIIGHIISKQKTTK